ncbi:hypothetical protein BGZ63DRAFT_400622 [Mariannaea sp. PMI_226]|nr:hypothetical protein BGZ63DRAFT_400622 [Mariannaea sp. PMI_226]
MIKTAFITGTNSGVGLALTKLFLSKGWNVSATARDTSAPALQELSQEFPGLFVQYLDLTKQETFEPAIKGSIEKFSKIDVLVNNAGYSQVGVLESLSIEDIRKNFEVNVFGTMGLIKEFLPHLRETTNKQSPSRIIYVGSGAAHFGLPLLGSYSATKAAMNLFMESFMYEMEGVDDSPIEVKIVCPHGGIKETNFNQTTMNHSTMDKMTPEAQASYGPLIQKTMQKFGSMSGRSMSSADAAETVWIAATDDDASKLRYFVGPPGGGANLQLRMQGGADGEDADEVDQRYIKEMRAAFM